MYPFSRNYYQLNNLTEPFVIDTAKKSLSLRYSLLKYYYSIYATKFGAGTVFDPLFIHFPDD